MKLGGAFKKQLDIDSIVPLISKEQKPKNWKRPCYYMYNRDQSILYYSSQNLSDYGLLGLHFITLKTHLKNRTYYLGKYSFSKKFIESARLLNMSFRYVDAMLNKDRVNLKFNKNNNK